MENIELAPHLVPLAKLVWATPTIDVTSRLFPNREDVLAFAEEVRAWAKFIFDGGRIVVFLKFTANTPLDDLDAANRLDHQNHFDKCEYFIRRLLGKPHLGSCSLEYSAKNWTELFRDGAQLWHGWSKDELSLIVNALSDAKFLSEIGWPLKRHVREYHDAISAIISNAEELSAFARNRFRNDAADEQELEEARKLFRINAKTPLKRIQEKLGVGSNKAQSILRVMRTEGLCATPVKIRRVNPG